nr:substrate-binding domain-containing protein [uncultured Flavobacterium sp.]
MKKKNISIRNIAEKLNISVTTVSFILNGKSEEKHISKKLTKEVLDYTQKVGYKPNRIAQSLRTGKSNILVFMVEDISNYFSAKLARIIEETAYFYGYKVVFCSTENNDAKSIEIIESFRNLNVDGFFLVPSPGIKEQIAKFISEDQPFVLFDGDFPDFECNSVVIDNRQSAFTAISHLIANGYKNIAFIATDSEQNQLENRLIGYLDAINGMNLNAHVLKIPFEEKATCKSKEMIKEFIGKTADLDAVFFAASYLTRLGLEVFKEINSNLIQDLGIVNFDDNEIFELFNPSITAISQPLEAIGSKLMELMLGQLNQKNVKFKNETVVFNTNLIIRESSVSKICGLHSIS